MSIISNIRPVTVIALIVLVAAVVFIVLCFTYLIKNLPPKAALWGMIAGIAVAAIALLVLLSPRESAPLFAPGEGTGETQMAAVSAPEDGVIRIRVREDAIYLSEQEMTDAAELSASLERIGDLTDRPVILTDDYASATAFHAAEDILDTMGISWQSETVR